LSGAPQAVSLQTTPLKTAPLDWLTARPVAHRGLHDAGNGVIENTSGAFRAAIEGGYAIETDVQISADGEAMVHHDDALGRLTEGEGRLDHFSAAALKRVPFRGSAEHMMTLGELCDLVAGRTTLLVELKGRFDGDDRLATRVADVLARYEGPVAAMSFDLRQVMQLRQKAPRLVRGVTAADDRPNSYRDLLPPGAQRGFGYWRAALATRPQFLAYAVDALPGLLPFFMRRIMCMPVLTWTVRSKADRAAAGRYADQMIFEGFRP
jgi:glycerophosphoryl diester phosphodiesterase